MTETRTIQDAREFGLHVKQGGWRLGLLVARNVEPAEHGGDRRSSFTRNLNDKVNATEFARESGTSAPRVLRYLAAWDKAAEAGHVTPAAELSPGQEIEIDADTLPDWDLFYPPKDSETNSRALTDEQWSTYQRVAAEEGTTAKQIARTAASPKAIRAALKADPALARDVVNDISTQVKLVGAINQTRDQAETRVRKAHEAHAPESVQAKAMLDVQLLLGKAGELMDQAVEQIMAMPEEQRGNRLLHRMFTDAEQALSTIGALLSGKTLDQELQDLQGGTQ